MLTQTPTKVALQSPCSVQEQIGTLVTPTNQKPKTWTHMNQSERCSNHPVNSQTTNNRSYDNEIKVEPAFPTRRPSRSISSSLRGFMTPKQQQEMELIQVQKMMPEVAVGMTSPVVTSKRNSATLLRKLSNNAKKLFSGAESKRSSSSRIPSASSSSLLVAVMGVAQDRNHMVTPPEYTATTSKHTTLPKNGLRSNSEVLSQTSPTNAIFEDANFFALSPKSKSAENCNEIHNISRSWDELSSTAPGSSAVKGKNPLLRQLFFYERELNDENNDDDISNLRADIASTPKGKFTAKMYSSSQVSSAEVICHSPDTGAVLPGNKVSTSASHSDPVAADVNLRKTPGNISSSMSSSSAIMTMARSAPSHDETRNRKYIITTQMATSKDSKTDLPGISYPMKTVKFQPENPDQTAPPVKDVNWLKQQLLARTSSISQESQEPREGFSPLHGRSKSVSFSSYIHILSFDPNESPTKNPQVQILCTTNTNFKHDLESPPSLVPTLTVITNPSDQIKSSGVPTPSSPLDDYKHLLGKKEPFPVLPSQGNINLSDNNLDDNEIFSQDDFSDQEYEDGNKIFSQDNFSDQMLLDARLC